MSKATAHLHVQPDDDHITAVCKASSYYPLVEDSIQKHMDTADPVPTAERLDAYVQACREVYANLTGRQRDILDRHTPSPGKPEIPVKRHGVWSDEAQVRHQAKRREVAASRPSLEPRWKPEAELGDADAWPYLRTGLRPVKEEWVKASEIKDAVYAGKTVAFDATEMFPGDLWNITINDVADLHGAQADDRNYIPLYRQMGACSKWGGYVTLRSMAQRHKAFSKFRWNFGPTTPWQPHVKEERLAKLGRAAERPVAGMSWLTRLLLRLQVGAGPESEQGLAQYLKELRARTFTQITLNTRRLEKLPQVQNIEKKLGSPDWLERTWSMFWTGAVGNWMHVDEPDNLLINVRGEMYVSVWRQEDTDIINGGRNLGAGKWDLTHDITDPAWLEKNQWFFKFPFIHMKLEPGQGVVVPSRTYHGIYSPEADRILLNVFMMPKYDKLGDSPGSKQGGFFERESQSEDFWAMYHLKTSSLYRLWDTKRLGGFFENMKFELL